MDRTLWHLSLNACCMFLFVESIFLKPWSPAFFAGNFSFLNSISPEPSFKNTKLEAFRLKINKFDYCELQKLYKDLSIHLPICIPSTLCDRHKQVSIKKIHNTLIKYLTQEPRQIRMQRTM